MDYDDYRKENKPVFTANDMTAATNVGYANGIDRGKREARKIIREVLASLDDTDRICASTDHLIDLIDKALA